MSFSVGAALKKVGVSLLTDKKVLKWAGGIVLGALIIIMIPFAVIISLGTGQIKIDTEGLIAAVKAELSADDMAKSEQIDKILSQITEKMKAKKFTDEQIQKAHMLYMGALYEKADDPKFVDNLVSCFKAKQTDEELIKAVNKKFGTNLTKDAFNYALSLGGDSDIVKVAKKELGNAGGEKYWRWYGFPSRVEWCCIFVSWCANQCGYLDSGLVPRYSVVDDGADWFRAKNQWLPGSATPSPGNIIFFDWEYDGLDGNGDHTGIVEKVENGIVYTIEGNSGDAVRQNQFAVGHKEILGYGQFKQPQAQAAVSRDAAAQVWTYLKGYGYSDSVAAGIIGNMMRECGGDTLDLDWNIVGHFNGDEFYGLCQWCLEYTPSGFKGASIQKQCEYLHQTIQSAFATYGGNYNGITYTQFLASDTRTAAIAFERVYERCGDYANEDSRRADNAEVAYAKFHK